ncbi:hypothetical protein CLU79DRAFT_777145 [Phycomyces nitens]|nr:hypothetical protein CLU79DRAFT_777145 [Phycomyces nitens]
MNTTPSTGSPNNYDRAGESSRIFLGHVKQYFYNLPLVTFSLFVTTSVIALVDALGRFRNFYYHGFFTQWLYLNVPKVVHDAQVHRLLVYPLASPGLSLVIINLLLSIPYFSDLEKRKGSLRTLWILSCLLTVLPGIGYVVLVSTFAYSMGMGQGELQSTVCAGMSGLVVGLSVWKTIEDQEEEEIEYRTLFGAIRIPRRAVPALTIGFYFFLAPDTSLILHICAAGCGYLCKSINPKVLSWY